MILIKAKNVLFLDLYDLQRAGVMVDTRLILDGELFIHWLMLDLYGYEQWWSGLGEAGGDNVIILPGVSLAEAQEFVDHLYGRDNIVSDRHFTIMRSVSLTDLKCVDFLVRNLYHYLSSSCGNSLEFVTIVWCVQ